MLGNSSEYPGLVYLPSYVCACSRRARPWVSRSSGGPHVVKDSSPGRSLLGSPNSSENTSFAAGLGYLLVFRAVLVSTDATIATGATGTTPPRRSAGPASISASAGTESCAPHTSRGNAACPRSHTPHRQQGHASWQHCFCRDHRAGAGRRPGGHPRRSLCSRQSEETHAAISMWERVHRSK
jgi:hypothetical protein